MKTHYASEKFKEDFDVVWAAVEQDGAALTYASKKLEKNKNYKQLVLLAVSKYGRALEYVSKETQNDKDVVLTAVKKYGGALEYASKNLKKDKNIAIAAINNFAYALNYVDETLLHDIDVICAALRKNPQIGDYLVDNKFNNGKHYLIPRETLTLAQQKLAKENESKVKTQTTLKEPKLKVQEKNNYSHIPQIEMTMEL